MMKEITKKKQAKDLVEGDQVQMRDFRRTVKKIKNEGMIGIIWKGDRDPMHYTASTEFNVIELKPEKPETPPAPRLPEPVKDELKLIQYLPKKLRDPLFILSPAAPETPEAKSKAFEALLRALDKTSFELSRVNENRLKRGVGAVEIKVTDIPTEQVFWMSKEDILKNVEEFGSCEAFTQGLEFYETGKISDEDELSEQMEEIDQIPEVLLEQLAVLNPLNPYTSEQAKKAFNELLFLLLNPILITNPEFNHLRRKQQPPLDIDFLLPPIRDALKALDPEKMNLEGTSKKAFSVLKSELAKYDPASERNRIRELRQARAEAEKLKFIEGIN